MEMDALKEKTVYPCEPASVEQLDKMLRVMTDSVKEDLKPFVFRTDPQAVRWEDVRHLRISSDITLMTGLGYHTYSGPQGFYSNSDGSWLLIVAEMLYPEAYVRLCSEALESLWITNTWTASSLRLGNFTRLTELVLDRCRAIPQLLGLRNLAKLTSLSLYGCRSLTELDLSGHSSLTTLSGLRSLTQLTSLNLAGCSSLAELLELKELHRLTTLNLNGCVSLNKLNLAGCYSLTELPGLGSLIRLTSLNLTGCESLTELPGLGSLTRLTSLDLTGCESLTELPGLGSLTRLTELNLFGCKSLTELPGLGSLTQLTSLILSMCSSLTQLPPLDGLEQLTWLILRGCDNLKELPSLDSLKRLTELDLAYCDGLKELPEGIRAMKSLRQLNLNFMKLRDLPDWLPEIAAYFSFETNKRGIGLKKAMVNLGGATVETIPDMSIFEQPYEVVAEFFRNRALGKTHPLNEIKVVFLGDGESGKSHTIARLLNDGGEPIDYTDQSTPGIVIRNKEYTVGDRTFTVHYWDFGGQEIMHSMHRIFLTGRTMYVILLNARDDTQSDRAKYWLHNVKSFAPDAPVLLVLNKIDQNPNASVDEKDLRGRYDKLTQIVRLSAKDFRRDDFNSAFTDMLLKEIEKTGFLDAQWPDSWTAVKKRLEGLDIEKNPYIMGDAYEDICLECQVNENQENLLHWFNDLGVSFCCRDSGDYALKDYVILRPDWITNALYIILFNTLAGARNGLIPHSSIFDILSTAHKNPAIRCTLPKARYNSGDIQYVLGIMRKFNLSFTDGQNNEFIPMLCQQNSMVDIQYYHKDAEILEFNMEFDYLPNNLLHRLMVERHTELDIENVWRTGARFTLPGTGLSAVLVIDGETLRFFIRHTDPTHRPNTYLTMLKAHVDRIVEKMGLKAPVCQLIYKLDGKRDAFDYEMLKDMQSIGQTLAFSREWRKMISISDILNQSAPDGLEDEQKLLEAIVRSCRNIQGEKSYYSSDEDTRNRRIRDDLELLDYNVKDQTQRGLSETGRGTGELDLLLYNDKKEPWTIIEALRVSGGKKIDWNRHLNKLVGNYNYFGAPCVYLLTYVDSDVTNFQQIWDAYQRHIPGIDPGKFTYCDKSLVVLDAADSPRYVKTAKCRYACRGQMTTAYHIFVQVPRH